MIVFILRQGGRVTTRRGGAHATVATLGALLLLLAGLAGTALGVEGPTKLANPSVSPRSGTPSTRISFAVDYRNREGSAPDHVRVVIDGHGHDMKAAAGVVDYKSGVRFFYRATLPAGTHAVAFEAADTRRFTAATRAGSVRISAATSGSTGGSTTGGTGSTGGATGGSSTGSTGGGSPTGAGASGGSSTPSAVDSVTGTSAPGTGEDGAVLPPVRNVGDDVVLGGRGARLVTTTSDGPGPDQVAGLIAGGMPAGPGRSDAESALPPELLTGHGGTASPEMRALAVAIGTSGAAAIAMAFLFFGKRRRDERQPAPDEVLEAAAAHVGEFIPATQLVPPVPSTQPGINPAELAMPRWRRPSLLEARKTDPMRTASTTVTLSFATGDVGLVEGLERRRIRYRVVRLLDAPDELRGTEIGVLDQGDEVQLVERNGPFWLVRCPDGRQGWVHRMTLGDVVEDAGGSPAHSADFPRPATPDNDVLSSFLRREGAS